MKISRDLKYTRERIERDDGSFFNLLEVKVEAAENLKFKRVVTDNREKKLFNIGYLRLLKAAERSVDNPAVIVWDAYQHSDSALEYFEDIFQNRSDIYMSLNAWITEKLRYLIKTKN